MSGHLKEAHYIITAKKKRRHAWFIHIVGIVDRFCQHYTTGSISYLYYRRTLFISFLNDYYKRPHQGHNSLTLVYDTIILVHGYKKMHNPGRAYVYEAAHACLIYELYMYVYMFVLYACIYNLTVRVHI